MRLAMHGIRAVLHWFQLSHAGLRQTCEMYSFIPSTYAVVPDCIHYAVNNKLLLSNRRLTTRLSVYAASTAGLISFILFHVRALTNIKQRLVA